MNPERNEVESLFNIVLKTIAKNFSLYGNLREDLPDNLFQRIVHNIEDVYLKNYIEWILEQHSKMELRGITKNSGETLTVPLDMIYVTLKGDFSSGYERKQSRLLFERELRELEYTMDDIEFNDNLSGGEGKNARALRWRFLSLSPFMPSLVERDRPWEADKKDRFATIRPEKLTVGKAFQKEQVLVILGDPGSGKTTLARFITQKVAINFKNKILQRSALAKKEQKETKGSEENHSAEEKPVNNNNNNETIGDGISIESASEEAEDYEEQDEEGEDAEEDNNEHDQNGEENDNNNNDNGEGEDESIADAMQIDGEESISISSEASSVPVNKKRYRKNPQEAMEDDLKTLESGPPKFPVLVRVSEYSEARAKEPQLKLIDFLGFHSWLGQFPPVPADTLNEMIKSYLKRDQAVIILDGLDEITTGSEREEIVKEVEAFVHEWVRLPESNNVEQYWNPWNAFDKKRQTETTESQGNQLIVTSRIAGYHACPLSDDVIHVTIEPLDNPSIERFCDSWTLAVHKVTSSKLNPEELRFKALSLKKSILTQPSVRELATNPLLLTTLALLHYSGGSLPKQRVELYRIAVQCLVEVWRNSGLMVEEVIGVLSPLAFHIHSHYPTGLIEQDKLKAIVAKSLAKARNIDPNNPPSTFENDVSLFLTALREQVGLLAARGEFLYGFLHLTFQEYLAAIYLVRDPDSAAAEILRRVNQPRWREVIILALGEVGHSWPKATRDKLIVDLLLTEHSGQLAPHLGVSLKSINEADVVMRDDGASQSSSNLAQSPTKSSKSPKRIFSLIWKKKKPAKPFRSDEIYGYINPKKSSTSLTPWSSLFPRITLLIAKILPEYASNPGVSIDGPIVAETIVRLLEIYCQNTHFDYIRMTRIVTNTHKKGDKSTYSPITEKFKTEVQNAFAKIRQEIPDQVDQVLQSILSVLKEKEHDVPWKTNAVPIKSSSSNNSNLAASHGESKTVKQSQFNRAYAAATIINSCEFVSATLGLALLDVVDHDSPHWGWPINSALRLMVRRDNNRVFETNEALKNKLKMRKFLQDGEQHEELLSSKLYRSIVALYGGLEDNGKFKPSLIYRDSLLTDEILPVLSKLKGKQIVVGNVKPLRNVLCSVWESSNLCVTYQHAEMKAQALLILSILGEDDSYVRKSIDSANNGEFEKYCVKLFLNHVARLTNELTIVIRNLEESPTFQALDEAELPETTKNIMMQMAWTALRNIADHKARTLIQWRVAAYYPVADIPKLLKEAHDSLLKVSQCVHENHDTIYEFAVALDLGTEPGMNLIKTVHGTPVQSLVFAKSLVPYMPMDDTVSIKSEALFHSIRHSERRWSELYLANLNLGTVFTPDLGLLLGSGYDTPDLGKFYLNNEYSANPEQAVQLAIKTITDAAEDVHAKARRFVRFSAWLPLEGKLMLLDKALQLTMSDAARSPKLRCDTLRLIGIHHPDVNTRKKLFAEAAKAAEEIPDKDIKAETLLALAPYLDSDKRHEVLQSVLNVVRKSSKEYQMAITLASSQILVSPYEKLKERHSQLVEKLKDGIKSIAKDRPPIQHVLLYEHMMNVYPELIGRWTPIMMINHMNSIMMEYSVPPYPHYETLWGALLDPLKQNQAVEIIKQYGVSQFYFLTNYIAYVVDSLLIMNQNALVADLLQYLWSPQKDLLPIVQNWFLKALATSDPTAYESNEPSNTNDASSNVPITLTVDEKILRYSALLLGEGGLITPDTVPVLIRCLRMGDDRSRHRAVLVFNGTERFESLRNVSQFGTDTALEIAGQALKYSRSEPGVSQILRWFWERTIHDDPEAIKQFVQLVNNNGPKAKEAHYLLSRIHLLAWSALDVLLDLLLNSTESVQIPLLRAADNLLHLSAEHLPERMRGKIQQALLKLHAKTDSDKVKVFLFRALEHDQKPIPEYASVLKYSIENDNEKVAAFGIVALAQQSKGATRDESYFMTLLEIEQRPLVVRAVREALAGLWLRHDIKSPPTALSAAGSTLTKLAAIAKDPLEALDALTDVVKHYPWYYPALISRYYRVAGDLYETAPWLIEVVLKRLVEILSKPLRMDQSLLDLEDVEARYAAIEACAAVCQRLPAAFANHAQEYPHLDQLLIDAVCDEIFFTSRASAMLILGYLRRVTANVRRAFESAISDVIYVNQRAFEAAGRFRYVSEGVLPALQSGLRHRSPAIAYGYARLLATVAQGSAQDSNESGDNNDRRSVMSKLAEALAEESERGRELYLLQETRDYRYEIIHVGKLHQAFLRMYLKIADVM